MTRSQWINRLPVSDEAKRVLDLMCCGAALRVPFDDSQSTVVQRAPYTPAMFPDQWPSDPALLRVSPEIVTELMESGLIGLLTRKPHLQKVGWEEAELDGRNAEFWCLVQ